MVTANSRGDISPMFLEDMQDNQGKIQPRLVDIEDDITQLCLQNLHFLESSDYSRALEILKNPVEYDFNQILNKKVA